MLLAFLACAAWVPALWGFGALLAPRDLDDLRPAVAGFLGFLVLATVAVALHLVAPVSPAVAGAAWAIGTALFAWRGRGIGLAAGPSAAAAMAAVLLALCALVQVPGRHYDMGLYYLQSIKWTQEQSQPLGVAVLHVRLGFNSSWFALAAMLEHPLAVGRSAFIANTLAVWFGLWAAWAGIARLRKGDTSPPALLLAGTVLPAAACIEGIGAQGPDYPAALLAYLSIVCWVTALGREGRLEVHGVVGWLLAALAVTVKLSTAPLLAASAVLLAIRRRAIHRRALAGVATGAVLLAAWVARGVLATGCPLFPSLVACATFLPWTAPPSIALQQTSWIKSWARLPGASPEVALASWDWLGPWARAATRDPTLLVVAALASAGAVAYAIRPRSLGRDVLAGWAIALAGVTVWFLGAPAPRFGLGFLFAAGLVPVAGTSWLRAAAGSRAGRVGLAIAAAAACVAIAAPSFHWTRFVTVANAAWVDFPKMPRGLTFTRQTATGLRVNVPWRGDQCWSAPLPCTPYFDPGLAYDDGMFTTSTPDPTQHR